MRRAHQHPRTWNVIFGQGEDVGKVVLELPDRDLAFGLIDAHLLGEALIRASRRQGVAMARPEPVPEVHLLRDDFTLACGEDGKVSSSGVLAEVTCDACKAVPQ